MDLDLVPKPSWISGVQIRGFEIPSQTQEFRNPSPSHFSILNHLQKLCPALPFSPKLFFLLSFSRQYRSMRMDDKLMLTVDQKNAKAGAYKNIAIDNWEDIEILCERDRATGIGVEYMNDAVEVTTEEGENEVISLPLHNNHVNIHYQQVLQLSLTK